MAQIEKGTEATVVIGGQSMRVRFDKSEILEPVYGSFLRWLLRKPIAHKTNLRFTVLGES